MKAGSLTPRVRMVVGPLECDGGGVCASCIDRQHRAARCFGPPCRTTERASAEGAGEARARGRGGARRWARSSGPWARVRRRGRAAHAARGPPPVRGRASRGAGAGPGRGRADCGGCEFECFRRRDPGSDCENARGRAKRKAGSIEPVLRFVFLDCSTSVSFYGFIVYTLRCGGSIGLRRVSRHAAPRRGRPPQRLSCQRGRQTREHACGRCRFSSHCLHLSRQSSPATRGRANFTARRADGAACC